MRCLAPNAILLRLLAGRMFSSMADVCLQSAKRRIEARKRREEREAQVAAFRAPRSVSGSLPAPPPPPPPPEWWQLAAASTPTPRKSRAR